MKKIFTSVIALVLFVLLTACGGGGGGGGSSSGGTTGASSSSSLGSAPIAPPQICDTNGGSVVIDGKYNVTCSTYVASADLKRYFYNVTDSFMPPVIIDGATVNLQVKLYLPTDGKLQHPFVIFTHGRAGMNPARQDELNAYSNLETWLVKQGYGVLHVERQGYGTSDGPDVEYQATPEAAALAGAKSLQAANVWLRQQDYVNPNKIVIAGHSQGGFVTVAAATLNNPGVVGYINMSGGVNYTDELTCGGITTPCTEDPMERALGTFGTTAHQPMLWVYASNDYHSVASVTRWFNTFKANGGSGTLFFTDEYHDGSINGHGYVDNPSYYSASVLAYFASIGFTYN